MTAPPVGTPTTSSSSPTAPDVPAAGDRARKRSRLRRRVILAGAALTASAAMILGGGLLLPSPATDLPTRTEALSRGIPQAEVAGMSSAELSRQAQGLQARLDRLPRDWAAWSALGSIYVAQAQATGDPSYYGRAEEALQRSLAVRPDGNDAAHTGLAALAAARHDFAESLRQAEQAEAINPYSAMNFGVKTDALTELGRYDEALTALQRMLDLRPGVASFSRASYSFELRGDVTAARSALERALAVASTPGDTAFTLQYLGELAFSQGDLESAAGHFGDGLRRYPAVLPLRAGRARVEAARGNTEEALADYAAVVAALPAPAYLLEYADLLASVGRTAEAAEQYAIVDSTQQLARSGGVNVDLELALYDADAGRAAQALAAAEAEYRRRRSVHVEDAYAWALHVNGRNEEALEHARQAARLGTRSAAFAYHRGMIERSLGMRAEARRSLQRALEINPHFSPLQAPRARAALREMGEA